MMQLPDPVITEWQLFWYMTCWRANEMVVEDEAEISMNVCLGISEGSAKEDWPEVINAEIRIS